MKTNTLLNSIAELNFKSIKTKLMDHDSGEGWSQAKADAMEIEYRRFLHLMHTFPNEGASPTKAVDTFWHYHILDTQKYAADCDAVFGCFMHHNPNADLNENPVEHSGERMQQLYEATFGEDYIRAEAYFVDEAEDDATHLDGAAGTPVGAQGGVCWAACMMQAKAADAQGAASMAQAKKSAGAEAGVCWAACMMQAKPADAQAALSTKQAKKSAGAEAGVCWAACMMQAKPAQAQAASDKQPSKKSAGAQSGVCWAACMMQAKPAQAQAAPNKQPAKKSAGAQSGVCWAACMMQAKPAQAQAAPNKQPAKKSAGAQSGVCWAACMMQAKPAQAQSAVAVNQAKPAGAQSGVCWAACMMQAKPVAGAAATLATLAPEAVPA